MNRGARIVIAVVLVTTLAGCNVLFGIAGPALIGEFDAGNGAGSTCAYDPELIPVCPADGYAEVCDTLGPVVTDGEDGIPRYECVLPSEAAIGSCDGEIGRLEPNVQSELRILHGTYVATPEDANAIGRCFRGRILVMPTDEAELIELRSISLVETAVDDSGLGAINGMREGLVDEVNERSEFVSSTGQLAVEIAFCVPDPTTLGSPQSMAAMVRLPSGVTSHPRCLHVQ